MAKRKQTSRESTKKLAKLASDVLKDEKSPKKAKQLAGSVLSQAPFKKAAKVKSAPKKKK